MNTPNPNKSQKGQDANTTNAMYSSSENNGTTLEEQLTYIKDTSKELISILWNSFRDYLIKQRQNNCND